MHRCVILILLVLAACAPRSMHAAESVLPYLTVCSDAGAGGYEAFPDLYRMPDGEMLCVFYAGFAHVSLPAYAPGGRLPANAPNAGRVCLTRSRDNGKTWSEPTVVVDTPRDDRDPSIALLSDGTLLCNYFSHKPGRRGRYEFVHSALVRSTDGGRTWSAEQPLFTKWACSSPIRRLSDGRLMLALYAVLDGGGGSGHGGVSFSTDAGKTWSEPIPIGRKISEKLAAEPDIIEVSPNRLLAGLRPSRGQDSMAFSWSTDGGRSWSEPILPGFPAHSIYFLLKQSDPGKGMLLMGHRIPGTSLHYSLDLGRKWSENVQLSESGGAYPSMVELPDGSVHMVYYEEGPQSDIRAMRFWARPEEVEVIPPKEWE